MRTKKSSIKQQMAKNERIFTLISHLRLELTFFADMFATESKGLKRFTINIDTKIQIFSIQIRNFFGVSVGIKRSRERQTHTQNVDINWHFCKTNRMGCCFFIHLFLPTTIMWVFFWKSHTLSTQYTRKVRIGNSSIAFRDPKSNRNTQTTPHTIRRKILTRSMKCYFTFAFHFICVINLGFIHRNERVNFNIDTHIRWRWFDFMIQTIFEWCVFSDDVHIYAKEAMFSFSKYARNQ